jgi:flagellar hook-associated protein 2
MAGTISMAGLASGMDVNGMIDALVKANSVQQSKLTSRVTETKAASSDISSVATLLGKLKTSVDAMADSTTLQAYAATSNNSSLSASVIGAASAGRYSVEVKALAQEYRAYSDPVASSSTAIGQSGTMSIKVGSADATNISITNSDTLDSIVSKINQAGIGVQATTFNDGSQVRLQLRGTNTGAGNEVTVSGIDLGLNSTGNLKQQAQSAHLVVDGYDVYSKTNQVSGAIPGVSLTASALTSSAATVDINTDASSLTSKIGTMVSAYNAVIGKVHTLSGYSTTAASDAMLSGDSTLRQVTTKMSDTLLTRIGSDSNYQTLNSLGVSLNRDGTLSFDESKLTKALATNPSAVTNVLAGSTSSQGVMDLMSGMADMFTRSGDGILTNKVSTLNESAKTLQTQADAEQTRLDSYRTLLEQQFQAMDNAITASNSTMTYLNALNGTTSSSTSSSASSSSSSS